MPLRRPNISELRARAAQHRGFRLARSRLSAQTAFSLVELLIVILIIGILATIAIPRFLGQRNSAHNSKALNAVQIALKSALSFEIEGSTGFSGFLNAQLNAREPALTAALPHTTAGVSYATMVLAAGATPGAHADPLKLYIASDNAGTPPTAALIYLCSASQGDKIICARGDANGWTWAQSSAPTQTIADVIGDGSGFSSQLTSGGGSSGPTATGLTAAANGYNRNPSISGDGSLVAFESAATNLLSPDNNNTFVDVLGVNLSNSLTLLSRTVASGSQTTQNATTPEVSADGRYVLFTSFHNAAMMNPASSNTQLWRYDRQTNTTQLASAVDGSATTPVNNNTTQPAISANGRYAVFGTTATNADPAAGAPGAGRYHIYVRDMTNQTTTLVSRSDGVAGALATTDSVMPAVSDNGKVVFYTTSPLRAGDSSLNYKGYLRDPAAGTTSHFSIRLDGTHAHFGASSRRLWISADGTKVAFANADDMGFTMPGGEVSSIFLRDLSSNTTTLIGRQNGVSGGACQNVANSPTLSADARYVVWTQGGTCDAADTNANTDVYWRDTQSGVTKLISRSWPSGAVGNADSAAPDLSADGRYVAFHTSATNIIAGDTNGVDDVVRVGPMF